MRQDPYTYFILIRVDYQLVNDLFVVSLTIFYVFAQLFLTLAGLK